MLRGAADAYRNGGAKRPTPGQVRQPIEFGGLAVCGKLTAGESHRPISTEAPHNGVAACVWLADFKLL